MLFRILSYSCCYIILEIMMHKIIRQHSVLIIIAIFKLHVCVRVCAPVYLDNSPLIICSWNHDMNEFNLFVHSFFEDDVDPFSGMLFLHNA